MSERKYLVTVFLLTFSKQFGELVGSTYYTFYLPCESFEQFPSLIEEHIKKEFPLFKVDYIVHNISYCPPEV